MFTIRGNIGIVSVDIDYLRYLYETENEVRYSKGYENKKYLGILVNANNTEYVIPMSSAKDKHKNFRMSSNTYMLIYEIAKVSKMKDKDIWIPISNNTVDDVKLEAKAKHILSLLDFKKMIPIKEGLYEKVSLKTSDNDSKELQKYKALLQKEYSFCVSNKEKIVRTAGKLYEHQVTSGKIIPKCCNFLLLEEALKKYQSK